MRVKCGNALPKLESAPSVSFQLSKQARTLVITVQNGQLMTTFDGRIHKCPETGLARISVTASAICTRSRPAGRGPGDEGCQVPSPGSVVSDWVLVRVLLVGFGWRDAREARRINVRFRRVVRF
jgi:hypothetical protein